MWEAMDSDMENRVEIFVKLLDEGTHVYRPVSGIPKGHSKYLIEESADYHLNDERWEFAPGSYVNADYKTIQGKRCLVACELASDVEP